MARSDDLLGVRLDWAICPELSDVGRFAKRQLWADVVSLLAADHRTRLFRLISVSIEPAAGQSKPSRYSSAVGHPLYLDENAPSGREIRRIALSVSNGMGFVHRFSYRPLSVGSMVRAEAHGQEIGWQDSTGRVIGTHQSGG